MKMKKKKIYYLVLIFFGIFIYFLFDYSNKIDDTINNHIKKALEGDLTAIKIVAKAYFDGDNIPQDYKQSLVWYKKAAEENDPEALYNVGVASEFGLGTSKNIDNAYEYYIESADLNYASAINKLASMFEEGVVVSRSMNQAVSTYSKSVGFLNGDAMYKFSNLYETETFGENLKNEYKKWLFLSILNGTTNDEAYDKVYSLAQAIDYENVLYDISNDLIFEARNYFFACDIETFLEKYKVESDYNIKKISATDEVFNFINNCQDVFYVDINHDDENEFISFKKDGNLGDGILRIIKKDLKNEMNFVNSDVYKIKYGDNSVIEYEGKYYFIVIYDDIYNNNKNKMEIFEINENGINEKSILFEKDFTGFDYVKTFQYNDEFNDIVNAVEKDIFTILNATINEQVFVKHENLISDNVFKGIAFNADNVPDILQYSTNFDNYFENEYINKNYERSLGYNDFNHLEIELYGKEKNSYFDITLNDLYLNNCNGNILQQLFSYYDYEDEIYYTAMLEKSKFSNNYSLSLYKADKYSSNLVANFLIYSYCSDIIISENKN